MNVLGLFRRLIRSQHTADVEFSGDVGAVHWSVETHERPGPVPNVVAVSIEVMA